MNIIALNTGEERSLYIHIKGEVPRLLRPGNDFGQVITLTPDYKLPRPYPIARHHHWLPCAIAMKI